MTEKLIFEKTETRLNPGEGRGESALRTGWMGDHPLYILRQKGRFPDIAYDHGRLLAREIDVGAFPEIAASIARAIDRESSAHEYLSALLHQTCTEGVRDSLSAEFRDAVTAVAEGYRAGSALKQFTVEDVFDAVLAIEVENILVGFEHRLRIRGARLPAILAMLRHSLPNTLDRDTYRALGNVGRLAASPKKLTRAAEQLTNPRDHVGFGCSAVTAPHGATRDGRHLHARNLDNHLYRWSRAPVIALIDETPSDAGYQRFVGFGTAGMIHPGGVSGINEAGLSVSIHQLTTGRYKHRIRNGHGEIGPYIPQRILREARTLDEAVDVARGVNSFSSWCVLVSSASEGSGMRIEINGDGMRATRSDQPLPQANHYIHPDMVEKAFDQTDAHFTPTFGKWLETRTRVEMLGARLADGAARGAIDTDWAIDAMAANEDHALTPPSPRAFGRVPCKSYGQMTSIVRGDPDRAAKFDEVWMSLGERRPACCSTIAGFNVDWAAFDLDPVTDRPLRWAAGKGSEFSASLHEFVEGVVAISRPLQADGSPVDRDPTEAERAAMIESALARLDAAVALAAADGIHEATYRYMRARVLQEAGRHREALSDFEALIDVWRATPARIHAYEAALILAYSVQSEDIRRDDHSWSGRSARLTEARALLNEVRERYFGAGAPHRDLVRWMTRLDDLEEKGGAAFDAPAANFIVIE